MAQQRITEGTVLLKDTDKEFKKRYLLLESDGLCLYKNEKKKKLLGKISFSKNFAYHPVHGHEKPNVIDLTSAEGIQWEISFLSTEEKDQWINVFSTFAQIRRSHFAQRTMSTRSSEASPSSSFSHSRSSQSISPLPMSNLRTSSGMNQTLSSPRYRSNTLRQNLPQITEHNGIKVPKEFPPVPAAVGVLPLHYTVEEYKVYMRNKMQFERWENGLKLYVDKAKMGDRAGMARLIEQLNRDLEIPAYSSLDENVPPEFPPPPEQVGKFTGTDQASYQSHMRRKLLREDWESYLNSYLQKKKQNDTVAMKRILDDFNHRIEEFEKTEAEQELSQAENSHNRSPETIPEGFPPPPPVVGKFVGFLVTDREAYKDHMRKKLQRQLWEEALQVYKKKERERDKAGCYQTLETLKTNLKALDPCARFVDESNLPDGFPPAPPKLRELFKCSNEQEYKEYMLGKYLRDTWEDAIVLYRQKQKINDIAGMATIVNRLKMELNRGSQARSRAPSVRKKNPSRFSFSPTLETTLISKKLYEFEQLVSPKDLNTDAQFQAKILLMLQELMTHQQNSPKNWGDTERDTFEEIKHHLEGQLKHIFINFVHYCATLDQVDLRTLIKLLEVLKGKNNVNNILKDCFEHAAKTTFILHMETASDNHQNSRAIKLAQVMQMVESTLNDELQKTTKAFKDYADPEVISIEVFHSLLVKETKLICSIKDSDPDEIIGLLRTYTNVVHRFQRRMPDLIIDIDDNVFDKWIGRWLESLQQKFVTWMDRAIENDQWEPVSAKVLFSVGVLSVKDSIRQNLEIISTIAFNRDFNITQYSNTASGTMNYYMTLLKQNFINLANKITYKITTWRSLDTIDQTALKFIEQNNTHLSFSMTPQMCTQFNNISGLDQVIDQLFEEIEGELEEKDCRQLIRDNLYIPTKTRLYDTRNNMLKHATDLMRPDIQITIKWVCNKSSTNKSVPLLAYLDRILCSSKSKLETSLFKSLLENIFKTTCEEIDKHLLTLVPNDLLGITNVFSNVSPQATSRDLWDLTNELCVWINANGEGIPQKTIDTISELLRQKLKLWTAAPTRNLINFYSSDEDRQIGAGITKRDILQILQSRKNDDPEAKEFCSKLGGASSLVSAVFGSNNKKEEENGNSSNLTSNLDFMTTFFGNNNFLNNNNKEESFEKDEKPPEEQTIFSAIYDWFQS